MIMADAMPSAEEHVIYQVANAPLRPYPFPHVYVENVFPEDFYAKLRRQWPRASDLVSLGATGRVPEGAYPDRFVMPLREKEVSALQPEARAFWTELAQWMLFSKRFFEALMDKFDAQVRQRFGERSETIDYSPEVLVLRDHTNYSLGPHTDSPHHLMSLLFYCPDDDSLAHLGTSIYAPIDPTFRCEGGPHYPHDRFHKIVTMPYRRNSLFAFFKTDNSFHGVEPLADSGILRDLMLYDIRVDALPSGREPAEQASTSIGAMMLKRILGSEK